MDGEINSTMTRIVDLNELAYRTGSKPEEVRRAGEALFSSLAGNDPDLSKALIAASTASQVEPKHIITMLGILAAEFRQPPQQKSRIEPPARPRAKSGPTKPERGGAIARQLSKMVRNRKGHADF